MIWLEASGTLNLVVGSSKVPLAEFIEFHEGAYILDAMQIRRLADLPPRQMSAIRQATQGVKPGN